MRNATLGNCNSHEHPAQRTVGVIYHIKSLSADGCVTGRSLSTYTHTSGKIKQCMEVIEESVCTFWARAERNS